jgi:isopenicillin N synthase-like dioxygenase
LNYSRPAEVTTPYINEAHEDGAFLTVAYANAPGLELRTADGDFVPTTNGQDNVLILPGEIAWLLSGGSVRPLYHRVRPDARFHERMTLLFFGDIDPGLCQPWVLNEVNKGVDIGARVLRNPTRFGLQEWKLE